MINEFDVTPRPLVSRPLPKPFLSIRLSAGTYHIIIVITIILCIRIMRIRNYLSIHGGQYWKSQINSLKLIYNYCHPGVAALISYNRRFPLTKQSVYAIIIYIHNVYNIIIQYTNTSEDTQSTIGTE